MGSNWVRMLEPVPLARVEEASAVRSTVQHGSHAIRVRVLRGEPAKSLAM